MSDQCCYCGAPSTTRDHVPTRKLFPEPRPSDLITVPSCDPCNNRLSPEEEYFIHVLISCREADTPVARTLREQLFAKDLTKRRIRMAHRMLGSMGRAPMHSPAGLYLGHAPTFTIDRDQFDRVADKITRGLYFHAFAQRVPSEHTSEVIFSPQPEVFENPDIKAVVAEGFGGSVGGQAFAYRIARAPEPPGIAICIMLFFGTIPVISSLLHPEAIAAYEGRANVRPRQQRTAGRIKEGADETA